MGDQVKVFGLWYSPFSKRVEIALKIKGVEYEYAEEDLNNKSEELLKFNPIHKKVPVLVHNGKHMAESQVILEYIDETWKDNGDALLLPTDPYDRAQARFWAKFIDDKIVPVLMRDALLGDGEKAEKATEEAQELLQFLENEINGKKFFGGNEMGFLDIVALIVAYWVPIFQEILGKEVLTKGKYPAIWTWIDRVMACDVVKGNVATREQMLTKFRVRLPAVRATLPK